MARVWHWLVVLGIVMALQLFVTLYFGKYFEALRVQIQSSEMTPSPPTLELIQQRNNLSKELNRKQKRLGQLECEKRANDQYRTSDSGGFCNSSSKEDGGVHKTDGKLATALADFLKGKSVASFGDGPGRYKQLLMDSGKVKGYDAYDGAPYCEELTDGRVKFLDLAIKQYGLPMYDWVMSLEVAEHIPRAYESVFVDNIVRHAREGVVLSWGHPGQGGYSHVNNRPLEYVLALFDSLGFAHDEEESSKLRNVSEFRFFRANLNVYRRRDINSVERLENYHT